MAETDSMFSAYGSIFDAATADNVGVRDRALQVAQLQPGRATVYGAHQAGGMLMQNLAGMAGMKTAEQQKAETITSIMKESAGLDPNDPQSARLLAQKFIQAGLPGIGQKFIERARTMDVKNQELALTERGVVVQEERLEMEEKKSESDIKVQESYLELDWGKYEHTKFQDAAYLDIATNADTRDQAKFEYKQKQDEILNALRNKEIDITEANQKLQANMFAFDKLRAQVGDKQWAAEFSEQQLNNAANRELTLAQKDDIVIKTEAYTENNNIANALKAAQTKAIEMETKLAEKGLNMPADGEYIMQSIKDGQEQLMKYNPDKENADGTKGGYDIVTDADGVALGLANVASQEWGMNVEEQRVYDNIWDQYKQRFYVGTSFGDGHWKEGYPDFYDWAQANVGEQAMAILIKGQGGIRGDYQKKLEADYNNKDSNDNTTVAVVMANVDVEEGGAETNVRVFDVDYKLLNDPINSENPQLSGYNIGMAALKEVPETINGVENTLTNGQYITKLMQQGREAEAEEYIATLPVARSTTADTKDITSIEQAQFEWRPIMMRKSGPTDAQKEKATYKEMPEGSGNWFKRESVKKDK